MQPDLPGRDTTARRRCAVVDDEPFFCELIEDHLTRSGFEVAVFHRGADFLASLADLAALIAKGAARTYQDGERLFSEGAPREWLGIVEQDSEFTGAMMQAVMVFYGLAMALIAVSVWETHSEVSNVVSSESSRLACLYRDVGGYRASLYNALPLDSVLVLADVMKAFEQKFA